MAITKRKLLLLTLFFGIRLAHSQEATQYFMTSLPQVSINNPAFVPRYDYSIGIPVISSIYAGYSNNGFSYNDMITKANGDVTADLSKWVKALTDKNYVTTTAQVDFLRLGFRINPKLYLQISSTGYEYGRVLIPKEAASLFVDGTAPLIGTSTSFSPQGEGLAYLETAVGGSFQATEKLAVGLRLKYLGGLTSVTTQSSSFDVSVGNDYTIKASGDLNLKTSGIQDGDQAVHNAFSNSGFGIDLGATLKVTDRLTVAASLIDLGQISWKNNLYAYTLDKTTAQYSFSGIDLKELVNGNTGYLDAQGDSIEKNFTPKETKTGSYSTPLPAKMYVSGSYELVKDLSVGGLFFTERFRGRVSPGVSASISKHFGKWASLLASYTVSNRSYNNFGLGVSFNLAPIQLYLVGDNLLRIPGALVTTQELNSYVNNTKLFNIRFGVNIVWGRNKDFDKVPRNTKSYNSKGKSSKEKVTDGDPGYLKVRKKH